MPEEGTGLGGATRITKPTCSHVRTQRSIAHWHGQWPCDHEHAVARALQLGDEEGQVRVADHLDKHGTARDGTHGQRRGGGITDPWCTTAEFMGDGLAPSTPRRPTAPAHTRATLAKPVTQQYSVRSNATHVSVKGVCVGTGNMCRWRVQCV